MSKRTDTIKSLFAAPQSVPLSADNAVRGLPRVSSGSVRSLKESFSDVEKENEELKERLAAGSAIVEVDPTLIEPSPVSDRFRDELDGSFEQLKQSIAHRGQEVPVLLRVHPDTLGRYQSAYGHRRVRAARELGLKVKAIVRPLSDEELVVAQGLENAPREDLSFDERAVFAMNIEDAGHARTVVQDALSVDRAEASKLIAVARAVPNEIVGAIGKAAKIGRGRWQALADLMADAGSLKRVEAVIAAPGFRERDSDARFLLAYSAASKPSARPTSDSRAKFVIAASGEKIARAQLADRDLKLTIDKKVAPDFGQFVLEKLPELYDLFRSKERH